MQLRNFSFIVLTLFILNSCTGDSLLPVKGPEGDPSTELSLAEFDDLPIPLNSKLDKEKSIIFSKKDGWYGRLTFNTSEKQINVYDFFRKYNGFFFIKFRVQWDWKVIKFS